MLQSAQRRGSPLPGHQWREQLGLSVQQSSRGGILCVTLAQVLLTSARGCARLTSITSGCCGVCSVCATASPHEGHVPPTVQPHSWLHPQQEREAATPLAIATFASHTLTHTLSRRPCCMGVARVCAACSCACVGDEDGHAGPLVRPQPAPMQLAPRGMRVHSILAACGCAHVPGTCSSAAPQPGSLPAVMHVSGCTCRLQLRPSGRPSQQHPPHPQNPSLRPRRLSRPSRPLRSLQAPAWTCPCRSGLRQACHMRVTFPRSAEYSHLQVRPGQSGLRLACQMSVICHCQLTLRGRAAAHCQRPWRRSVHARVDSMWHPACGRALSGLAGSGGKHHRMGALLWHPAAWLCRPDRLQGPASAASASRLPACSLPTHL